MQGGQRWKKNSLNKEKRVGRSTLPLAKQNVIYFKTYENRILYKSYAGRSETQKKLKPLLPVSMYKRDGSEPQRRYFMVRTLRRFFLSFSLRVPKKEGRGGEHIFALLSLPQHALNSTQKYI